MAVLSNELYIGKSQEEPDFYFCNTEIISVNGETSVDLVGKEMAIDTLTAVVNFFYSEPEIFKPTDYDGFYTSDGKILCGHYTENDLRELPYATPVWFYNGGRYIGKYYLSKVTRTARAQYEIEFVSIIGLLDSRTFYGGYYIITPITFKDLVERIFLTTGLEAYQGTEYIRSEGIGHVSLSVSLKGSYRVKASFYYESMNGDGLDGTSDIVPLLGYRDLIDAGKQYCVAADVTRADETAAWPDELKFKLHYGTQVTEAVTISPGTRIDIDINPAGGYFSVNDTVIPIAEEEFTLPAYFVAMGMYSKKALDTGYNYSIFRSGLNLRLSSFTIYDNTGKALNDYIPGYKLANNAPGLFNTITKKWYTVLNPDSCGYGPLKNINLPNFKFCTEREQEIADSIYYDEGVADLQIYGWIASGSKRDALHQALLAYNVNLLKAEDGSVLFTWIYDVAPTEIPDDRIYLDGEVEYAESARKIEVTEHDYFYDSSVTPETLFDNTDSLQESDVLVEFSQAPIYVDSLKTDGSLVIEAANENVAIVSGIGTLKGRPYTHTTSVITKINPDSEEGETVSVTDATLITLNNSANVVARLYEYYTRRYIVRNSIVMSGERMGGRYRFKNAFGELTSAYLSSASINASSNLKAECEYIANYTPIGQGGNYQHAVLLTGSGTWTVPAEVYEKDIPSIRVILIGGGTGGSSGYAGNNGYNDDLWSSFTGRSASGGKIGSSGAGGKVLTIDIENPDAEYTYSCGEGGAGGDICYSTYLANDGQAGTDTTFGNAYSSATGSCVDNGIHNFFDGKVYGKKPDSKLYASAGGFGGFVKKIGDDLYTYYWGGSVLDSCASMRYQSETRYYYIGGETSTTLTKFTFSDGSWTTTNNGCGGGAAVGENGSAGAKPYWISAQSKAHAGNGGKGGNATLPAIDIMTLNSSYYGWGGIGGNGGGAGGNTGGLGARGTWVAGEPGTGGYGGKGGKGAPGCILIYY